VYIEGFSITANVRAYEFILYSKEIASYLAMTIGEKPE